MPTPTKGFWMPTKLNLRKTSAILAGLRLLQHYLDPVPGGTNVEDILTNDGTHDALSVEEINELCEGINTHKVALQ